MGNILGVISSITTIVDNSDIVDVGTETLKLRNLRVYKSPKPRKDNKVIINGIHLLHNTSDRRASNNATSDIYQLRYQ
jgi:hypothetical protein